MTRLDEELAQAVRDAEATGDEPASEAEKKSDAVPATTTNATPQPSKPKRSIGLVAALLVMGGGILALVLTSFDDAAVFSKDVDQLLAERERLVSRDVHVTGMLVKGSLTRRDEPCEYRFRIEKNGVQLPVHYPQCIVPDTFRDVPHMDVNVTATGKLTEEGHFEASHIMAKCPSKYEEQAGKKAPHKGMFSASTPGQARN